MEKLTPEILEQTEDWRDLYLTRGQEMLVLAEELLAGKEGKEHDLGFKIIEGCWFEEDEENKDAEPSLSKLSFTDLIKPLEKLAAKEPRAVYGLLVACREDVSVLPDTKLLLTLLDNASKEKVSGMSTKSMTFRLLIHAYGREKEFPKALALLKEKAGTKTDLFDELGYVVTRSYDISSLMAIAIEGAKAKGEARAREGVEMLRAVENSGGDISEIVPYLRENQKKLAMFTDVLEVLGIYYLKNQKYDELESWLNDEDLDVAAGAYRAIRWALAHGIDGSVLLARPGISDRLEHLKQEKRLPSQDEFNSMVH